MCHEGTDSRILLRDDLLAAKAACDPHRTSPRAGLSRPGRPRIVGDLSRAVDGRYRAKRRGMCRGDCVGVAE
jgi:hypothetical protein